MRVDPVSVLLVVILALLVGVAFIEDDDEDPNAQ